MTCENKQRKKNEMENIGGCSTRNTTKTDLSLLLECLKFQMKCPDSQKQALLTINSICENREDNVDLFRELGGVTFVYNLSKTSVVHPEVKEAALFTLGTLAESNVYCKNSLCRKEIFTDISGWLVKEDLPLTLRRVTVYLLFVLVANNKSGQTLAQTTGCLDILLDLFRSTFPLSAENNLRTLTQTCQLWASVSSALCGCVNNPQNEEAQRICVAAFPTIKTWLQQISLPCTKVLQPICSFISMTVANNSVLASGLSQYGLVFHLFSLLSSSKLEPEDRLSVLLNIGQCTAASDEHQSQLVQCGGLPVIITLLTEDTNEEVKKAATFILQTCKQATMRLTAHGITGQQAEDKDPCPNLEDFKKSARDLLIRINRLEQRQLKEDEEEQEDIDLPYPAESHWQLSQSAALPPPVKTIHAAMPARVSSDHDAALQPVTIENCRMRKTAFNVFSLEELTKTNKRDVMCSVRRTAGVPLPSNGRSLESGSEPQTANGLIFEPVSAKKQKKRTEIKPTDEFHSKEIREVQKLPTEEPSFSQIRCAGCVVPFEKVTSRNFASLQSFCHSSCDMHRVLKEATERFRKAYLNRVFTKEYQDIQKEIANKSPGTVSNAQSLKNSQSWNLLLTGVNLTPLHRGVQKKTLASRSRADLQLTPLKRPRAPEDRRPASDVGRTREYYA
ncbi:telomere repeats-binding bouquet formation protein 1 isoform X3 [Oryzias melastigma]|uniref:telomere repeats-binding bouquet formation protein 1 isoform X3 n=1 Tax=Oryzias melastigma TaxID=30732 RepID=UPI00168D1FC6|nr:telomere repeats-binding bouquet formation protein 1 isoform X3 [Oryzias melastigma]